MNIEEMKKDREQGVMFCRVAFEKLLDAALEMQQTLINIAASEKEPNAAEYAAAVVTRVDAL